jgi:hypothetical protein
MKKFTLFLFLLSSINLYAAWGLYDADRSYIVLNVTGVSTTKTVWSSGAAGTGFFNGADFGTFSIGQTFELNAYDIKIWKNNGGNVTGGKFYYIIYPSGNRPISPIFTSINLGFMSDLGSGNQKWGVSGLTTNLLNGLLPGAYSLEIYAEMYGDNPTKTEYDGNNGNNYIATFKIAPSAFNVTGTGSYCQGNGGLPVGLSDSETGVTYTLSPGGTTLAGTGDAISFGNQLAGTYTISGSNAGGTTAMNGNAVITQNPTSVGGTISGGTNVCSGSNSTVLTLANHVGSVVKWQFSTDNGGSWEDIANIATTYTATDLTVTTQYQAIVKSGECTSAISSVAIITVYSGIPTSVSAAANPNPVCAGATLTLTGTAAGATSWSWTGPNSFTSAIQNPQIANVTSAATGVYYLTASNVCGAATEVSTLEVLVNPTVTPSVTIVASATTVVSGTTVEFTATPVNGGVTPSYAWFVNNSPSGFNLPNLSITPLQGTEVYVVMTSSLPCTSPVQSTTITMTVSPAPAESTWDGSTDNDWHTAANWSDGVPGGTTDVTIPAGLTNFPTISSAAVCHDITLKSGASILGNNNLSVTGAASVEREISGGAWHLISSPVAEAEAGVFLHDYLQKWDEPTAKWTDIENENELLTIVHGYSLYETTPGTSVFTGGALNEGTRFKTLTVTPAAPITNRGANLVGNPYPSYLDWNTVSGYGACYVWNGSTYLAYPATGGYGTGSRYIAPAQGFFVMATSNGTFTLTNANRVHNPGPFYKSSYEIPSNSLMLEAFGNNYSDKLIIRYDEETTQDFDMETDAHKLASSTDGISQLYSYSSDKKLSIDVRPSCEEIQLGFTNTLSGQYQIGISEMNGISKATLEDTKTATFHNLLKGPFSFSYTAGEDDKRFKIRMGSVGIDEPTDEICKIYSYDKTAVIDLPVQTQGDIYIYNLAGQLIASKESATGQVRMNLSATGIYVVKVVLDAEVATQKIWIR